MSFLDPVFNPVFQPLLRTIGSFWTIMLIAVVYSVYATYIYKYLTNQSRLKEIKGRQKELQKELRVVGKENPDKMMSIHKELMSLNKDYMFQASFKPRVMIATMLPALVIFTWMAGALAYEPIAPGQTYTVVATFAPGVTGEANLIIDNNTTIVDDSSTLIIENTSRSIITGMDPLGRVKLKKFVGGLARWNLKSTEGMHNMSVLVNGQSRSKDVIVIVDKYRYAPLDPSFNDKSFLVSDIRSINIEDNKLKPLGDNFKVPLFNWYPGWLGIYVILSIVLSIGLRKVLNVY